MSRRTPDERFAAAVGDELERRVRAVRLSPAAPAGARPWITAAASLAVLAIVAAVTAGLVGLRQGDAGMFGAPLCSDGGAPVAPFGCGSYRVVGATSDGAALPWAVDDTKTITFRASAATGTMVEPDCDLEVPVRSISGSALRTPELADGQVACGRMPVPGGSAADRDDDRRAAFLLRFFSGASVRFGVVPVPSGSAPELLLRSGSATLTITAVMRCSDGAPAAAPFTCADYRIVSATAAGIAVEWPTDPALEFRAASGTLPELNPGCSVFSLPVTVRGSTVLAGSTAAKRIECPVTGGGEARWMVDFWSRPVHVEVISGPSAAVVLTSGTKTLRIEPVAPAAPSSSPGTTTSSSRGCPATGGSAPLHDGNGAMVVESADVDGDGRPDRVWAQLDDGGMRIGITTASGATVTRRIDTAAADPSLVVGASSHGVAPVLVGNGHGAQVFAFVGCAIVETLGADGAPLRIGAGGATGTGVGCSDGRLLRYGVTGEAARPTVEATRLTLSADGRSVSGGGTSVLGRDLDPKSELITIAHAVTCQAVILHPAAFR